MILIGIIEAALDLVEHDHHIITNKVNLLRWLMCKGGAQDVNDYSLTSQKRRRDYYYFFTTGDEEEGAPNKTSDEYD